MNGIGLNVLLELPNLVLTINIWWLVAIVVFDIILHAVSGRRLIGRT